LRLAAFAAWREIFICLRVPPCLLLYLFYVLQTRFFAALRMTLKRLRTTRGCRGFHNFTVLPGSIISPSAITSITASPNRPCRPHKRRAGYALTRPVRADRTKSSRGVIVSIPRPRGFKIMWLGDRDMGQPFTREQAARQRCASPLRSRATSDAISAVLLCAARHDQNLAGGTRTG